MTQDNQQRIEKATAELKEAFSDKLQVKFKKLHPDAMAPVRATDGAAGWDLTVLSSECYGSFVHYKTGVAVEIPSGYFGLIVPRSSCYKLGHWLTNGAGIIDNDYRGEICFNFYRFVNGEQSYLYQPGERCGQLLILPCPAVELIEVEKLSQTERGVGGFGSTGR